MSASVGREARLAYLTTAYPNVSHTFIRREIQALENLGHAITRIAIRPGTVVVDPDDVDEDAKTVHVLGQPKGWLVTHALKGVLQTNVRLIRGLVAALKLNRASERGLLRHLAYVFEALVISSYLKTQLVEHVHVHFGTNAAAVALLMKIMGGPTFSMTVHGPDEFDAPFGFSLGWKMREAVFTAAITHYCQAQLKRWVTPDHWHKLHIVPCTVSDTWFEAARPIPADADSVVCVGRLSEQKGQLVLIDALASAVANGFQGRIVMVGDGAMRQPIEELIRAHGLEKRVTITGWSDGAAVRRHILDAKALIVSSFAEGLPVVIMEAMALERPIISTTIMGIPELVRDGRDGWLVTAGDAEALGRALCRLEATPIETLRNMGASAQQRVAERHSIREITKLDELFRELAS